MAEVVGWLARDYAGRDDSFYENFPSNDFTKSDIEVSFQET